MVRTVSELAKVVGGIVFGDSELVVCDALPLQNADRNHLTLVDYFKNQERFLSSNAVAAVAPMQIAEKLALETEKTVIGVDSVHAAFISVINLLRDTSSAKHVGVSDRADISPTSSIDPTSYVGPFATIGAGVVIGPRTKIHSGVRLMDDVTVGADCEVFPNVVVYERTQIEDRVTVYAGAVIGAYGFGYRQESGKHVRTSQLGWVHIESDVEIGANSTVDRGTYGPTQIGHGSKIDNLVQIGHNVRIGGHNLICSQTGIAGSSSTGDYVVLGGQVGLRDHIRIGDRVMVGAQSGVAADVESDMTVLGSPALPHRESTQMLIAIQRVPEMRKQFRELVREVAALQQRLEGIEESTEESTEVSVSGSQNVERRVA